MVGFEAHNQSKCASYTPQRFAAGLTNEGSPGFRAEYGRRISTLGICKDVPTATKSRSIP